MKASGSKIIIKPRRARQAGLTPEGEREASEIEVPPASPAQDEQDDAMEDADAESEPQGSQKDDADDTAEGDDDGTHTPTARMRGRGRGRGRGSGRPRGRPRGAGRGRGRGRGKGGPILLRLPKRVDSDGLAEGGSGPVEDGDDSQVATPAGEDFEPVEPVGGGKPFRIIQGQAYIIENDEFITDDDPKGDTKIDANGNLLGGRAFKAQTFVLPNRHPERKYMLAIDAARTSGFRDSLYYFRRNLLAFKLNATQPEKEYLIEAGKLGSHLRTRSVTLITARSAYKLHGSKTILDGKLVVDDYYEDKALIDVTAKGLKAGDPVGDLPDPQQQSNEAAALAAANKAAAGAGNKGDRGSGLGVYRTGGPTTIFGGSGWGPFSDGPLNVGKKAMLNREGVTEENWMMAMAERTLEANREWTKGRREALKALGGILGNKDKDADKDPSFQMNTDGTSPKRELDVEGDEEAIEMKPAKRRKGERPEELPLGIYEPHSGIVHYRNNTQPTRSRWVALQDSKEKRSVLGGTKAGNGAWALAWVDTVMELPDAHFEDEQNEARQVLMGSVGMS